MTGQPIKPEDLRVGDTVRVVDTNTIRVTRTETDGAVFGDCLKFVPELRGGWTRAFVLVDRPQPKPEVGQHWIDPDGNEWVIVSPGPYRLWAYPLWCTMSYPAVRDATRAVVFDGWTLKDRP